MTQEFRQVLVSSWVDLGLRLVSSANLLFCMMELKYLLQDSVRPEVSYAVTGRSPKVGTSSAPSSVAHSTTNMQKVTTASTTTRTSTKESKIQHKDTTKSSNHFQRRSRQVQLLFVFFGLGVLATHLQTHTVPHQDQCLLQTRPWFEDKPSCSLLEVRCNLLSSEDERSGSAAALDKVFSNISPASLTHLVIRNCPKLQMPSSVTRFFSLNGIKMYNNTIDKWTEEAAVTRTSLPRLAYIALPKVNFTDGVLPKGLLSPNFL